MKRILVLLISVIALTACNEKVEKEKAAARAERDSLQQIVEQKNAELNDIMSTFNDIQAGFRDINEAENRITLHNANPERGSKAEILEDIVFIKKTMQLNRELIAQLRKQLKSSSYNTTKLHETIENLTQQLDEKTMLIEKLQAELNIKEGTIAAQSEQISNLNSNVGSLTAESQAKSKVVEAQDKELNTAWYVFGTKKELRDQKILQKGDVLKTSAFNKDYFTKIDIRVDKVVRLYSKTAKLLTIHPAESYSLDKDGKGQYTLRITDAAAFWSVSRYLVIQVK